MSNSPSSSTPLIGCNSRHATAVGALGHIYIWGDCNEDPSETSVSRKLGFYSQKASTTDPVYFKLDHPYYDLKVVQISSSELMTAVVVKEAANGKANEDPLGLDKQSLTRAEKRELKEQNRKLSEYKGDFSEFEKQEWIAGDEDTKQLVQTLKLRIRHKVSEYLAKRKILLIEIFRRKILRKDSLLRILIQQVSVEISRKVLESLIQFSGMQMGHNYVNIKPIVEIIEDMRSSKGRLYILGIPQITPKIIGRQAGCIAYSVYYPEKLLEIKKVACSDLFVVILTDLNKAYIHWDSFNKSMQHFDILKQTMLSLKPKFIDICCGSTHALGLTENGFVYFWGSLKTGKESYETEAEPKRRDFGPVDMKMIRAGQDRCLCVSADDSKIYEWGQVKRKRLSSSKEFNSFYFWYEQKDNNFLDIYLGVNYTIFVTDDKKLIEFNDNTEDRNVIEVSGQGGEPEYFYQVNGHQDTFLALSTTGSIYT